MWGWSEVRRDGEKERDRSEKTTERERVGVTDSVLLLVVTKQWGPTGLIKCLLSLIIGCLRRERVQTLMNKSREK